MPASEVQKPWWGNKYVANQSRDQKLTHNKIQYTGFSLPRHSNMFFFIKAVEWLTIYLNLCKKNGSVLYALTGNKI